MDKSKSNASDPFAAALRLLTRRDRSEAELREKLRQFGFAVSAIDETVAKCRDCNYLDDQRYACERARTLMRSGRGVGHKVRNDLRHRGLSDTHIEQAVEQAERDYSSDQILREQLDRRFPGFDYTTSDERLRRRVISFFQRRGFSLGQIFTIIKEGSDRPDA